MPMIWCCNKYGIKVFLFEQFANVLETFGSFSCQFFNFCNCFGKYLFINITDISNFYIR